MLKIIRKKRNSNESDYEAVDSFDKAEDLYKRGILKPLYLFPLQYGGEEIKENLVFVPGFAAELKERYDLMVGDLLNDGLVSKYNCTPKYRGTSFIPSSISIVASGKGKFEQTIQIW